MANTNSTKGKAPSTTKTASKGRASAQVGVSLGDLTEAFETFHSALEEQTRMTLPKSATLRRLIADGLAANK